MDAAGPRVRLRDDDAPLGVGSSLAQVGSAEGAMKEVHQELLRRAVEGAGRAEQALEQARHEHARSSQLEAFVRALRKSEPGELVRCAWCGRVRAGAEWIDPSPLLGGNLRERLRRNASHGICPECFERVSMKAEHSQCMSHS